MCFVYFIKNKKEKNILEKKKDVDIKEIIVDIILEEF